MRPSKYYYRNPYYFYSSSPSGARSRTFRVLGLPRTIKYFINGLSLASGHRGGFGLVEVMVAVTVIMIVLGGTGALVNQSINATGDAREKIIAEGLAQDMLEKARNNRDMNRELNNVANGFPAQGQTVTVHNTIYCKSFINESETGLEARRITATIKWPGCTGEQEYILTTILQNYD